MNEDAPLTPSVRAGLGHPGVHWSGDGRLGPPVAERAAPSGEIVPASVRLRAAGFAIDLLVLFGVLLVLAVVALLTTVDASASQDEMQRQMDDLTPLLSIVGSSVQFAYNLVWNTLGWSPGKRLMRLRTVDAGGAPPRFRRGLVRTLVSLLSGIFYLGYVWALWDREHRTVHDRVAKTYVVRLPAEAPTPLPAARGPNG